MRTPPPGWFLTRPPLQCRMECKDVPAETLYDVLHDIEYRKKWDTNVIETFDIGRLTVNSDVGYYACEEGAAAGWGGGWVPAAPAGSVRIGAPVVPGRHGEEPGYRVREGFGTCRGGEGAGINAPPGAWASHPRLLSPGKCPKPLKNRDVITLRSWLPMGTDYIIMNYSVKHPVSACWGVGGERGGGGAAELGRGWVGPGVAQGLGAGMGWCRGGTPGGGGDPIACRPAVSRLPPRHHWGRGFGVGSRGCHHAPGEPWVPCPVTRPVPPRAPPQKYPPRKDMVRAVSIQTGYLVEGKGAKSCTITYLAQVDPKGERGGGPRSCPAGLSPPGFTAS